MKSSLKKYLPQKNKLLMVQARIDEEMFHQINKIREKEDLTWSELLRSLFLRVLKEYEIEKK